MELKPGEESQREEAVGVREGRGMTDGGGTRGRRFAFRREATITYHFEAGS